MRLPRYLAKNKFLIGTFMFLSFLSLTWLSKVIFLIDANNFFNNNFDNSENTENREKIPKTEYELLRRRIRSNTLEIFNYIQFALEEIKQKHQQNDDGYIESVKLLSKEHINAIISDMDRMKENDGYEKWRQDKAQKLSELVQRRIDFLQNPKNCSQAKKLICRINDYDCGFGCQMHHLFLCLIMSYATERTFILDSRNWMYTNRNETWEEFFLPLSKSCVTYNESSVVEWVKATNDSEVVDLSFDFHMRAVNKMDYFKPLSIPYDLASDLIRLHGMPSVWWLGQFASYFFRFQPETQKIIDRAIEEMNFKKPIVGIHIRRTDKITSREASFHSLEEYMQHVETYYERLEMFEKIDSRRVFIASDDSKVIDEARNKYPNHEFIANVNNSKLASNLSTRYTQSSLYGIIIDIHLLSLSDYLVCTLSSKICRAAFELMQTKTTFSDVSHQIKSLDDIFYFAGQLEHDYVAVLPHRSNNADEISLNIGDVIGIAGNHWNGYSKGRNRMNNQEGLFPSFKVVDTIRTAKFPEYLNAN